MTFFWEVLTNHQLIRIADDLEFPCSASHETLRFDVYSPRSSGSFGFTGTVAERLNVLSDPKQIKDHLKTAVTVQPLAPRPQKPAEPVRHTQEPSVALSLTLSPSPYVATSADTKADVLGKFLALVALGPITKAAVELRINARNAVSSTDMASLFATNTQAFLANDSFTEDDVYPSVALGASEIESHLSYVILKDKAYKDLRPWLWRWFSDYERGLIIDNANNALSRLGYLDTHPLRRRIVDKAVAELPRKPTPLGGGLLMGKRASSTANSPAVHHAPAPPASPLNLSASSTFKRAATDSPRPDGRKKSRTNGSPLKEAKRPFVALLSLSLSEDEKQNKSGTKEGKRSNSSGSNNSMQSTATLYTLPSSVNEEPLPENPHSEDDSKLGLARSPAPRSASTVDKKQQYYIQLAEKFRVKYLDYTALHAELTKERKGTSQEKKKKLMKLFELHNTLAEWKRKLWDYHNVNNMAQGIMNLSRHKKTNSGSAILAPTLTQLFSEDRFSKASTTSPAVRPERFGKSARKPEPRPKSKVALDY